MNKDFIMFSGNICEETLENNEFSTESSSQGSFFGHVQKNKVKYKSQIYFSLKHNAFQHNDMSSSGVPKQK